MGKYVKLRSSWSLLIKLLYLHNFMSREKEKRVLSEKTKNIVLFDTRRGSFDSLSEGLILAWRGQLFQSSQEPTLKFYLFL